MKPPVQPEPKTDYRNLALWLFVLAVFVGGGAVWAWSRINAGTREIDLGQAPEFELVAQSGEPFPSSELEGSVWMVDFFFTRCGGICPTLTARMGDLQDHLQGRDGWRLVSISVDPEYDTPEVLREYAARHDADLDRWTFLTGEKDLVRRTIIEGFLLPVQDDPGGPEPVLHSSRIVLVDETGKIRGLFDALDAESFEQLKRKAVDVLEEAG